MTLRYAAPALASLALAACIPRGPEPTPAPPEQRPAEQPAPVAAAPLPAPAPVPPSVDWMDAPQTAGDWSYGRTDGGSLARFGQPGAPVFGVGCMISSRRVVLLRYDARASASTDTPMVIRTETSERSLVAKPSNDGVNASVALAARDPLLDAIAFSKGRFAVEVSGLPALHLPSWPEITRVIEDCR